MNKEFAVYPVGNDMVFYGPGKYKTFLTTETSPGMGSEFANFVRGRSFL